MLDAGVVIFAGLPEGVAGIVAAAGLLVLGMIILALGAFVYKSLTGGIEWPEDKEDDDDKATKSHSDDDEWDYY